MESEHAAVPQTEIAAPAAAPAMGGGAAPLGALAGPLTPARVLAMQRGAGNAAVAAMLQRQEATKEKTPVTGPGDFGVSGGAPQVGGKVTARLPAARCSASTEDGVIGALTGPSGTAPPSAGAAPLF